jgi:hypothetical protein
MVIALILSLTLTCIGSVMVYTSEGKRFYDFVGLSFLQDIDEHEQHLIEKVAGNVNEESDAEFWEETHELLSNLTLFLILLHITGVILSSRLKRQNLIKSMIYCRKKSTKNDRLKDKHSLSIKTGEQNTLYWTHLSRQFHMKVKQTAILIEPLAVSLLLDGKLIINGEGTVNLSGKFKRRIDLALGIDNTRYANITFAW